MINGVAPYSAITRVLLVDNHDSFTGNVFHQIARLIGHDPLVIRNDEPGVNVDALLNEADAVVLSPGPGTPLRSADIGWCAPIVEAAFNGRVPLLGVCLGHQVIGHLAGATVGLAPEPRHGRESTIRHDGHPLFAALPSPFTAVRYHSLAVHDLPSTLRPLAWSEDGVLMALRHHLHPVYGVQFHPESIRTTRGDAVVAGFLALADAWWRSLDRQARRAADSAGGAGGWSCVIRSRDGRRAEQKTVSRTAREDDSVRGDGADWIVLTEQFPVVVNPEVLFDHCWRPRDHAYWLDASAPDNDTGLRSIMGSAAGPLARILTVNCTAGTFSVRDTQRTHTQVGSALEYVAADLTAFSVAPAADRPGFSLGWVGYLGYEMYAECDVANPEGLDVNPKGFATASPNASGAPDAVLVFTDRALVFDHGSNRVTLLALADPARPDPESGSIADARAWFSDERARIDGIVQRQPDAGGAGQALNSEGPPAHAVGSNAVVADAVALAAAGFPPERSSLRSRHGRDRYLALIAECLRQIRAGESYELCLTNDLTGPALADPWETYQQLRRISPSPLGSYLHFGDVHVLSTSFERFLCADPTGALEARPVKGTRPRSEDQTRDRQLAAELMGHEKDRAENLMVVDLVRHDLSKHAEVGSVQVPHLFEVRSYPAAHQMLSTVQAQLRPGRTVIDAFRAAFPPGSMTGAPKERTMRILHFLEQGPRGVYSGVIGYFSLDGSADFAVAIRTAVTTPSGLHYGVGGAVVALSDPGAEYEETIVKAAPLLRVLKTSFPYGIVEPPSSNP
ncbi:MAG: chorismate-binding protein [Actinomycetota bacterium]